MINIILFDDDTRTSLLPLTYTRPVADLRIGILTIKEKWERAVEANVSFITQDYLVEQFPIDYGKENYVINGAVLPSKQLIKLLLQMEESEAFLANDELIAAKLNEKQFEKLIHDEDIGDLKGIDLVDTEYIKINHLWDIFSHNSSEIKSDFEIITSGRSSAKLSDSNRLIGPVEHLFIEEGASVEGAILNTVEGPIYIGKEAKILEGALVRGPMALCDKAILKMGAKIYGGTTVGPVSKVGGEVNKSVIWGYTNKAHDGYLGNSVIGAWCNLGADSNTSNLKNNYGSIKVWDYLTGSDIDSGLQFCGLVMGDHSKCGINTMFNTGSVVGVCCNIFGMGYSPKFIPSYSWGGSGGLTTYKVEKAFDTIERVMDRRKKIFEVSERLAMIRIHEDTAQYRTWEG